jgi:transcriptional regulator with XRE-family HTH domain
MNEVENVDIGHLEQLADSLIESHDALLKSLIALRKKHHLTQETVAERMGVSQPTVAAFERYDANPKLSTIRRYALAVGAGIRHEVDDACCRLGTEDFIAIVAPSSSTWERRPRVDWSWSAGPAIVETNVYA